MFMIDFILSDWIVQKYAYFFMCVQVQASDVGSLTVDNNRIKPSSREPRRRVTSAAAEDRSVTVDSNKLCWFGGEDTVGELFAVATGFCFDCFDFCALILHRWTWNNLFPVYHMYTRRIYIVRTEYTVRIAPYIAWPHFTKSIYAVLSTIQRAQCIRQCTWKLYGTIRTIRAETVDKFASIAFQNFPEYNAHCILCVDIHSGMLHLNKANCKKSILPFSHEF